MKTSSLTLFCHLSAFLASICPLSAQQPIPSVLQPLLIYSPKPLPSDWLLHPTTYKAAAYRSADGKNLILSNRLISRKIRVMGGAGTVALDNLMTGESVIRGVKPEGELTLNGARLLIGGLQGQPNYAFLRPEWEEQLQPIPGALQLTGLTIGTPQAVMDWKQVRHHDPNAVWPPKGVYVRMDYRFPDMPAGHWDSLGLSADIVRGVIVQVHYELYDGLPAFSKWLTVKNGNDKPLRVDRFVSEELAVVEYTSWVDSDTTFPRPNLHVETDFAFASMAASLANKKAVHWEYDPDYSSQVSYERKTPCLLRVYPDLGPAQTLQPGETFESFRTYVLVYDSYDRERKGLAQRRFYRTLAPWSTENPLMMHVRFADWETVKNAIDQCAEVGFEMVILTFGSGFNIEDDSPEYLAKMKQYADYARSKGVEIGGYSLLASRRINPEQDVVLPPGQSPTFGNSPCLQSAWGQDYFRKLYQFYEKTGFALLEHDGSYPGDPCLSEAHPGHRGWADSRWNQWRMIRDFYQWCRAKGIYLNVPDYYYLSGANKCAMGYREVNWSLPRAEQVIHTRQNIYDGTWEKTPAMGWMFVPLTEYQGGGAAATIEPLAEHLDHYERMLVSNLGAGVQACYRGPRLYDSEPTKNMVKRWVNWFKAHREVLEGDLIHLRRPDGRDIDYWLKVNPGGKEKALLMVYNPLETAVEREITVPLYYAGLADKTQATIWQVKQLPDKSHDFGENSKTTLRLDREYEVKVRVRVPAGGFSWVEFK